MVSISFPFSYDISLEVSQICVVATTTKKNMKKFSIGVHISFLIAILFMVFIVGNSLRVSTHHYISVSTKFGDEGHMHPEEGAKEELGMKLYPTGSSLPDCSHACGPCFPCKRVIVSFKCSIAESCPIVYRCMCKGKYYHVPSN